MSDSEDEDEENIQILDQIKDDLYGDKICLFKEPYGMAQILDHLYIGNKDDAEKVHFLKTLGVTHVLNCACANELWPEKGYNVHPYSMKDGIKYMQLEAGDNEYYPIYRHFAAAKDFIDEAKFWGGKALVHCHMGVNRSGAIVIAYVMDHERVPLIPALRTVKIHRPVLLINPGFQRQLIEFARTKNLLYRRGTKKII